MNYSLALKYTKKFMRNKKEITPELTNDWELSYKDNKINLFTDNLDLDIVIYDTAKFMKNNILNGKLNIEDGKIIGCYALTSVGLVNEEEINFAQDMIDNRQYIDSEPFNMYLDKVGNYYIRSDESYQAFRIENGEFHQRDRENYIFARKIDKKMFEKENVIQIAGYTYNEIKFVSKVDWNKEDTFLNLIDFIKSHRFYIPKGREFKIIKTKTKSSLIKYLEGKYYLNDREMSGLYVEIKDINNIPNITENDILEDYINRDNCISLSYREGEFVHFFPIA